MKIKIVIDAKEKSEFYLNNHDILAKDIEEFLNEGYSPLTEIIYTYGENNPTPYQEPLPVMAARLGSMQTLDILVAAGAPDPKKFKNYQSNDEDDLKNNLKNEINEKRKLRDKEEINAVTNDDMYNLNFYKGTLLGKELFKQASLDWINHYPEKPLPCIEMSNSNVINSEDLIINLFNDPKLFSEIISLIKNKNESVKNRIKTSISRLNANISPDFLIEAVKCGFLNNIKKEIKRKEIVSLISCNNIEGIKFLIKNGVSMLEKLDENDDIEPFVFYAKTKEMIYLLGEGGANLKAIAHEGKDYQEQHAIENASNAETLECFIEIYKEDIAKDENKLLKIAVFKKVFNKTQNPWDMAMVMAKNGWSTKDFDFYGLAKVDNEEQIKWCVQNEASFTKSSLSEKLIRTRNTKAINQLKKWGVNIIEPGMLYNVLANEPIKTTVDYMIKKGADPMGITPSGEYEYFGIKKMEHLSFLGLGSLNVNELMNKKAPNGNNFINTLLKQHHSHKEIKKIPWMWNTYFREKLSIGNALKDISRVDYEIIDHDKKTPLHYIMYGSKQYNIRYSVDVTIAKNLIDLATIEDSAKQDINGDTWLHILLKEKPVNYLSLIGKIFKENPEKLPLLILNEKGESPSDYLFKEDKKIKIKSILEWKKYKEQQYKDPQYKEIKNEPKETDWVLTLKAKYKLLEQYAQEVKQSENPILLAFENDPEVQYILLRYAISTPTILIDTTANVGKERVIDIIEKAAELNEISQDVLTIWREKHLHKTISTSTELIQNNRPKI